MEDFEKKWRILKKKWRILKKNGGAISEALGRIFTPGSLLQEFMEVLMYNGLLD